jgi:flagellar FliL protein
MKKLLLILFILLLLGGGGAAVWWFFLRTPEEGEAVEAVPPPVLTQIDLPLTSIGIIKNGKVSQRIDFLISLVFDDPEKQARVQERLPRVNDAILAELHGLLPRKMVEQGGYDRAFLEQRLTRLMEEELGAGAVYKIYIRDMQVYK